MFRESLRIAGYDKYLAGKIDEKALQNGIARYWSSVADTGGYSTYDSTRSKRPRVTADEIQAAIRQARAEADHLTDLGQDPGAKAWR